MIPEIKLIESLKKDIEFYDKYLERIEKFKQKFKFFGEKIKENFVDPFSNFYDGSFDHLIKDLSLVAKSNAPDKLKITSSNISKLTEVTALLNGRLGAFGIASGLAKTALNSISNTKFLQFFVKLKRNISEFISSFRAFSILKKTGQEIGEGIGHIRAGISKVSGGMKDVYSNFKSVASLVSSVFKFVDGIADNLNKAKNISVDYGVSTEGVLGLEYAAKAVGLSMDDVESSLKQVSALSKNQPDLLKQLGIDGSQNPSEVLNELSQKWDQLDDKQREVLSQNLDSNTLKLLRSNVSGLTSEFQNMSQMVGLDFEEIEAKSQVFNTGLHKIQGLFSVLGTAFGAELMGPLSEGMGILFSLVVENMDVIKKVFSVLGRVFGVIIKVVSVLAKAILWVVDAVMPVIEWVIGWVEKGWNLIASLFGIESKPIEAQSTATKPNRPSIPSTAEFDTNLQSEVAASSISTPIRSGSEVTRPALQPSVGAQNIFHVGSALNNQTFQTNPTINITTTSNEPRAIGDSCANLIADAIFGFARHVSTNAK